MRRAVVAEGVEDRIGIAPILDCAFSGTDEARIKALGQTTGQLTNREDLVSAHVAFIEVAFHFFQGTRRNRNLILDS
jgi:hypothetical protein